MRWVYVAADVDRPVITKEELTNRQLLWGKAVEKLSEAGTSMSLIISDMNDANEGAGVDQFTEFMVGTFASPDAISKAKNGARELAKACATAGQELADAVTAMDAAAATAAYKIANPSLTDRLVFDFYFRGVIDETANTMQVLGQDAAERIKAAFDFKVDIPLDAPEPRITTEPEYGMVNAGIRGLWKRMTPEQRAAVLKQLVIQHGAENGITISPDDIRIGPPTKKEEDKGNGGASGVCYDDGEIWLNDKYLEDDDSRDDYLKGPLLIHTAAHEAQHAVQNAAITEYGGYNSDELQRMRDKGDNPFSEYGLTMDEVEAMARSEYVDSNQDFQGYFANPEEVDARQSGREAATMSESEFRAVMDAAGVSV